METHLQNMILKYISSSLEIDTLLPLITESVLEAIGLDLCAIVLLPNIAGNKTMVHKIHSRLGDHSSKQLGDAIEQGELEAYLSLTDKYIDNQVKPGAYSVIKEREISSLLIMPLVKETEIQGALICGKSQFNYFEANLLFLENVSYQLLFAIQNASIYPFRQ